MQRAKAFSAMRGGNVLFPNGFEEALLFLSSLQAFKHCVIVARDTATGQ